MISKPRKVKNDNEEQSDNEDEWEEVSEVEELEGEQVDGNCRTILCPIADVLI